MTTPATTSALARPEMESITPTPLPPRLPDESPRWYARFLGFVGLGVSRSVDGAFRAEGAGAEGDARRRAPGSWHRAATAFRWVARAAAFDAESLAREAAESAVRRRIEREKRRDVAARLLDRVGELIDSHVLFDTPGTVAIAVEKAAALHAREFGSDEPEEDGALVPATAPSPTITFIVSSVPRKFELPPPGQVEEATDTV